MTFLSLLLPSAYAQTHDVLLGEINQTANQSCTAIENFSGLVNCFIKAVISPVVLLLIGAALVVFLYGVLTYIRQADNATKREDARKMILFSIIAFFVMFSIWGLVNLVVASFPLEGNNTIPIPKF